MEYLFVVSRRPLVRDQAALPGVVVGEHYRLRPTAYPYEHFVDFIYPLAYQ